MEEIKQTSNEKLDIFLGKLIDVTDVISAKLINVAPDVAEGLLTIIQAKGIFEVSTQLVFFALFLSSSVFFGKKVMYSLDEDNKIHEAIVCSYWIIIGFSILMGIINLCNLFVFYNWVAAFYPEGAVALLALEAAGIKI